MIVRNPRCQYQTNPLGIDAAHPALSWELDDPRRGARQTAYQIVASQSAEDLCQANTTLWDTGKVPTDQSIQIVYAGPAMQTRRRYHWQVRVWDENDQPSQWSEPAWWEMGFLHRSDWTAKWISSSIVGGPYSSPPAPYLRREFIIDKPIASARLYATALGLYEFEINGQTTSDNVFLPGRTEYTKRVPYHIFDVTHLLTQGPNACGAILGDGWYCGHLHSDPRQTYGDRPRLLAQLEIHFTDGSTQTIVTDETWKSGEGPIRSSDMLMGEDYDARMEIPGWSAPGFDDRSWQSALIMPDPGIQIVAHRAPPIRPMQQLKPIAPPAVSANKRRHIFDLGQNMVGRVRLRIRNAKPGQTIDLRHVEMLDKDGKPYTLALRSARATDHYTTRGGGEEFFEPHFTFHGFRYVEVRDYPGRNPTVDDVTGIVLHSDAPPTGEFECSEEMINQLQSNIIWSQKGNFLDIPTDCPQRDERLGWTGDAQVFIRTAAFNMDVANFFSKWLFDMVDSQGADGRIPSVVPHVKSLHNEGGPAWSDAAIICPWTLYLCYGDKQILADCYPMMSRFMQFLQETCPACIRPADGAKWRGYGDWLSMNADTPAEYIGTAFYAHCANLMSRIAGLLGNTPDVAKYTHLANSVREAFQKRFVSTDGTLTIPTQTACVLALHFNLIPDSLRPTIAQSLVADIQSRGMHLSTGFVGTPYLNDVLTSTGHADVAYALLQQTTNPSWLYPITQGATTMWERWDGWTHEKGFNDAGMNSYNHYAFGAIGHWLYASVAGIDLDAPPPGYKHIVLRPTPGGTLTSARATLHSIHGPIHSAWKIDNNLFKFNATIPPNTTATLYLPCRNSSEVTESDQTTASAVGVRFVSADGKTAIYELQSGSYRFSSPLPSP